VVWLFAEPYLVEAATIQSQRLNTEKNTSRQKYKFFINITLLD
jgi:hypothetical protein